MDVRISSAPSSECPEEGWQSTGEKGNDHAARPRGGEMEGVKLRRRVLQQQKMIEQLKSKVESLKMALARHENDERQKCARCVTWEEKMKQAITEGTRQVQEMKRRLATSEKCAHAREAALLSHHAQEVSLEKKRQEEKEREWKERLMAADRERRQAVKEGKEARAREKEAERRLVVEIGRREGRKEEGGGMGRREGRKEGRKEEERNWKSEEGGDGKGGGGGREGGKTERSTQATSRTKTSGSPVGEEEGGREGGKEGGRDMEALKERLRKAEGMTEQVKLAYWRQGEVLGRALEAVAKLGYSEAQYDCSLPPSLLSSPSCSETDWRMTSLRSIMRLEEEAKTYLKDNPCAPPVPSSSAQGEEEGDDGWVEELEEDQEGGNEEGQELKMEDVERVDEWLEDREEKGKELYGGKEISPALKNRPNADAWKDGDGPAT
ncbi:hypothetical protein VYU27_009369 [Nannochloropsis oceanica]